MDSKRGTTAVQDGAEQSLPEEATDLKQLAAELQHLYDLLEREQIEEARRHVKELQQRWPEAERVQHYVRVLAPPVARSRPDLKTRRMDRERAWLREHACEYPGLWLAVREDRLIAADADRRVVVAKVRDILGDESALLFYQPERSAWEVERPQTTAQMTEQERLAADMQYRFALLEKNRVEDARKFVKELEQRWPESEQVRHYAQVLAPPVVRRRTTNNPGGPNEGEPKL